MSTISASTTTTTAFKITTDTTGALVFQTGSTPTTAMTLDASQNMGLGVTPSSWSGVGNVLEFGSGNYVFGTSAGQTQLGFNNYYNGTNYLYKNAGPAGRYQMVNTAGSLSHIWSYAASGSAGGTISFTAGMTLDASGNFLVGTTSATYSAAGRGVIEVNGSSTSIVALKTGGSAAGYVYHDGTDMSVVNTKAASLQLSTNGTERARIDSSGNFGIGINAPTQKLDVYGTGMKVNNASYVGYLGAGNTFAGGSASDFCVRSDNVLSFATGGPYERARIDTSGNLLVGTTSITGTSSDNRIVGIYGAGSSNRAQLRLTNSNTGTTGSDGTAISVDSSTNFYITQYENASVVFETNGANERMRVDPSGRVLIGTNSSQTVVGNQLNLQVHGTGSGSLTTGLNVTSWYSDVGYGGNLVLAHVRSGTVGTQTATVSGTELGTILFAGSTGSAISQGATITGWASDSTWTGSSTPAYLGFYTAPVGSTGNFERMRINSSGQITLPYQPAFMAVDQAATFTPASGTYNYATAKLNRGSHYNTSNGRFTAPVTGVYYFCHMISARPTSTAVIEAKIYVNGVEYSRTFICGVGSVPNGMASLTISLSANDYVEAAFYNGNSPAVVLSGSNDISTGSNGIVSGWMGWLLG